MTGELAVKGDARAQFRLGCMYDMGIGMPEDDAQAVFWYRKGAELGDAEAQHNLGIMFHYGNGVPKDYAQAALWFRKAAEQGDAVGQNNLGGMYLKGQGVPKDEIEAYAWFNTASVSLNLAKSCRNALEKTMAPEAIMKAQARTRELQKMIEERKAEKKREAK